MTARIKRAVLPALAVAALALTQTDIAEAGDGVRASQDLTMGVATVAANVVYIPCKLVYAGLGGVTGAIAYGLTLGSRQTATDIWVPSLGGDYVLTTDMVSGRQPFQFKGRPQPEY